MKHLKKNWKYLGGTVLQTAYITFIVIQPVLRHNKLPTHTIVYTIIIMNTQYLLFIDVRQDSIPRSVLFLESNPLILACIRDANTLTCRIPQMCINKDKQTDDITCQPTHTLSIFHIGYTHKKKTNVIVVPESN